MARYSGAAVALHEEREEHGGHEEQEHAAARWRNRLSIRDTDPEAESPDRQHDAQQAGASHSLEPPGPAGVSPTMPIITPDVLPAGSDQAMGDVFRSLIKSHPIAALHTLPRMSVRQRSELSATQIDALLVSLTELAKQNPEAIGACDRDRVQSLLAMIPDILESIWSARHQTASAQSSGHLLKNKRLVRFMRVCAYFGALPLALDIWKEKADLQRQRRDQRIIMPDDIARVYAARKHWSTLLAFFAPDRFDEAWLTPVVLEKYAQALLATGRPEAVQKVFERHAAAGPAGKLEPTSQSYAYLIQAHLSLGDVNQARQVAARAKRLGSLDEGQQQMAILRGHRSLGMDERIERRILDDLKRLDLSPKPPVLNMLIRLRLDAEHLAGARELLRYFDLERLGLPSRSPLRSGPIAPDYETLKLAFAVIAKADDLAMTRFVWHRLNELQSPVEDEHVLILIYALGRQGLADEAYRIVRSIVTDQAAECPVPLQQGFKAGIKSLNALLSVLSRAEGYDGLQRTSALFRRASIIPDDFTLKIVLDFAKTEGRGRAADMAGILAELLQSAPHLKPTIHQLDTIMAHAVASGPSASVRSESSAADTDVVLDDRLPATDVAERLRVRTDNPELAKALRAIVQSLRATRRRGTSRALATRLQFDAQRFVSGHDVPSPREVWSTLIARGYQPDHRHLLALMRGYAESGHMAEAEEILELAGTHVGADAFVRMHKVLISGWGKAGDYSRAQQAFTAVRNSARGADLAAITALIDAAHRCGRVPTAAALVHGELASLLPRDSRLDARAAHAAARALRANGEELAAIQLVRRLGPQTLDKGLRLQVRRIRNWARRTLDAASAADAAPMPATVRRPVGSRARVRQSSEPSQRSKPLPDATQLEGIVREADDMLGEDDRLRPVHQRHVASVTSKQGRRRLRRALRGLTGPKKISGPPSHTSTS